VVGWFEIALGVAVLFKPARNLLLFVVTWKVGTEFLRYSAGEPMWEFIERGGSYAAPLALLIATTWLRRENAFAQVSDPLTGPLVAPFNPVQDRHVGQRNLSVMQLPAGQSLNLNLFSQNLSWTAATTLLEVQMLEGEALETVAMALGSGEMGGGEN
jgi:hypothetical protein